MPHEFKLVQGFIHQHERGEIDYDMLVRQVTMIHDGLMLGGRILEDGQETLEEEDQVEPPYEQGELFDSNGNEGTGITGKFAGSDATDTEWESGAAKEIEDLGPLKPGKLGHQTLYEFKDGERMTAYDVSWRMCRDYHGRRREVRRLFDRGYLAKQGTLPNHAVNGRDHVDAFVITPAGEAELARLGPIE